MRPHPTGLLIALLFAAQPSWAQNDGARSTAREVAAQGLAAYDAGHFEEAVDKLLSAYEAVPVPSLAVFAARALSKTGHLIRASEMYMIAQQLKADPSWQAVQLEMQQTAAAEREQLKPRIPRLQLVFEGATAEEVEVSIDGTVIPRSLVKQPQLVDPGLRKVVGRRGAQQVVEQIEMKEGQAGTVALRFVTTTSQTNIVNPVSQTPTAPPTDDRAKGHETYRLLGWIGIGVGGAGLALGDTHCYWQQQNDVDSYNRMRTLSSVGFIAGGVIAAAGVTLLLTAPKSTESPSAALFIGPQSASLLGRF